MISAHIHLRKVAEAVYAAAILRCLIPLNERGRGLEVHRCHKGETSSVFRHIVFDNHGRVMGIEDDVGTCQHQPPAAGHSSSQALVKDNVDASQMHT